MDEAQELIARIEAFVREEPPAQGLDGQIASTTFETLAIDAFSYQARHIDAYRRLCASRGLSAERIGRWQQIPAVPTSAFARMPLHTAAPREVFRSSGTTGGARSVHHHPFPDLYRTVIDQSFPRACLAAGDRPPMLALVPPRDQLPDSSLGFMIDHVMNRFGAPESTYAFGARGVDVDTANRWCRDRAREGRAVLVLATAFALAQWLDALDRENRSAALPAGSRMFETGGFKGRTREITRSELLARIERRFDVAPPSVVREYGMTELTSQLYSRTGDAETVDLLFAPPWVRLRVLDPETLDEQPPGAVGIITIFDLANLGSAVHVMTEDLGQLDGASGGLRLLGRAGDADLRGCSLTVEELAG